jgi:y4mF family transcriptional regulator
MQITDSTSLAAAIRSRRRELSLTQEQLADLAGISLRSVTLLESGVSSLTFQNLLATLSVLGLSLNLEVRSIGG